MRRTHTAGAEDAQLAHAIPTFHERSARLDKSHTCRERRQTALQREGGGVEGLQEVDDAKVHGGLDGKLRKVRGNFGCAAVFEKL